MTDLGHRFPHPDAPSWRCERCGCLPGSLDARMRCFGAAPEAPADALDAEQEALIDAATP